MVKKHPLFKIYVEGGGDSEALRTLCRTGFSEFFRKMGLMAQPRIVVCGGRHATYDDFCLAVSQARPEDFIVLLVDSEEPVQPHQTAWQHLKERVSDGWKKPSQAGDEHAQLIVQCMEAWFLADRHTLVKYYGKGFSENALPPEQNPIEQIGKETILKGLEKAAALTLKEGYAKGKHSFKILALLDPAKVINASPWAARLANTLKQRQMSSKKAQSSL